MGDLSLQDLIVFLVAAGLVVPAFKAMKLSPVLGFILAGFCVGPYGVASLFGEADWLQYVLITDQAGVGVLAELGVIFLLFMIGLELSLERLWAMRKLVLGMGNIQILATGALVAAIAYGWGNSLQAAIILGGCLALSSTAMVLQLLVEQDRFSSPVGHASFSILLAQDIAVVPLLFLVATFGQAAGGSLTWELAIALGRAAVTVVVIFLAGRLVLKPLFRAVGRLRTPELFMATTLLVIIATAAITHQAGLSAALGAFLAGLLLSESEYRHEIELHIEPFKGLLLGLFFMSIAMGINLATVAEFPALIALSAVGLIVLKTAVTTAAVRLFGYTWSHALASGVMLAQGGEFAFVIIGMALSFALLPEAIAQFMLIVVAATMILTPLLAVASRKLEARMIRHDMSESKRPFAEDISDHVVLIGFGRTGQLLSDVLNRNHIPFLAVDRQPPDSAQDRTTVLGGDATHSQTIEKLHLKRARALVVCINNPQIVKEILQQAHAVAPDLPVLVRTHDETQARTLLQAGVQVAVPEVLESGLQLARALLIELEVPERTAAEMIAQLRPHISSHGRADTADEYSE